MLSRHEPPLMAPYGATTKGPYGAPKRADGGSVKHSYVHAGAIRRATGGRTDNTNLNVLPESFVVPADVVSALPKAEGNSEAGHSFLDNRYKSGPAKEIGWTKGPVGYQKLVHGDVIPIVAAGGEHVLTPSQVAEEGDGDLEAGHHALRKMVEKVRAKNIKTLKQLPKPHK